MLFIFTKNIHRATILLISVLFFALSSSTVFANGDRVDHFKGKVPATIAEAKFNLLVYNQKLTDILAKDKVTPDDMAKIHVISYTMEDALKHLATELTKLQDDLEKIHIASEKNDLKTINKSAPNYLLNSFQLFN